MRIIRHIDYMSGACDSIVQCICVHDEGRQIVKRARQVRIIAGTLKGRNLLYPTDSAIRPSMQQIKAAVFDSLGAALNGAVFIDLFAAAGGVGIEAISRGAGFVHFVENNETALDLLRKNLTSCRVSEEQVRIHSVSVFDFLTAKDTWRSIIPDIIYADPPYDTEDPAELLTSINFLNYPANCTIILEHRRDLPIEESIVLNRTKLKKFGRSWVSFFVPTGGKTR
jgi:16S rRNA (guanine(966)-N(2))-methyltransferase RsmD